MSRDFTCVVSGIVMLCLASILLVAVQMFKLEPMFLKVNPVAMYANPSGSFAVPDSEFESVFHSIVANGSATIKSRVLEHMLQVYSSIYQPLRITGFHLTAEERSELSSNALTYGEITIPAFDSLMLDLIDSSEKAFNCKDTGGDNLTVIECDVSVSMTPRRVFMDLGSGTSKTVLHAFLSGLFTESIGIEVASTRVKQSCEVLELVSKRPELTQHTKEGSFALVIQGSFLDEGLMDNVTHLYTSSTCFTYETLAGIFKKLDRLPQALTIGSHKLIPSELVEGSTWSLWNNPHTVNTPTSWSKITDCNVYAKTRRVDLDHNHTLIDFSEYPHCKLSMAGGTPVFSSTVKKL